MLITSAKITLILVSSKLLWRNLRPELLVIRGLHLTLAFWTGVFVPDADVVATAVKAQASDFATVGGSDIGDDASDDDVLNRFAVGATHGCDLLTEEPSTLVNLSLITA